MNFDLSQINWLAVLVAAVASFLVGGIWYGLIFGKAWLRLHSYSSDDIARMAKSQARTFMIFFICYAVMALVLALMIVNLEITSAAGGAVVGGVIWAGFGLTNEAIQNAAHRRPLTAFLIDTSHFLACLIVSGAILGAWR